MNERVLLNNPEESALEYQSELKVAKITTLDAFPVIDK